MKHRSSFAVLMAGWIAVTLCAAVTLAGLPAVKLSALGALRSGDPVLLDPGQGLWALSPGPGGVRALARGFGEYEALDMTTAVLDGDDAIFVTLNLRAAKLNRPQLARFNGKGERTGAWSLRDGLARLSGVAVDAQKKMVYVANAEQPEIYKLDLGRSPRGPLIRLSAVRGAERLGSMVFDARRGRLLVVDPYLGRVYAYDLASGRSEPLVEKVGEAGGLALDPVKDRLFIADANGGRVLVVELSGKPSAPTPPKTFAQLKELREPLGLASDGAGGLWVSGRAQSAVFRLSSSGQLTRRYAVAPR